MMLGRVADDVGDAVVLVRLFSEYAVEEGNVF